MTTIPLRPEHATRVRRIAGVDQRLTIRRILTGYAYPENGNVHNPTPRYQFLLQVDGVTVDTATLERVLRQAAKDNGAAYLAEMDQRMVEAAAADGPDGPFARQITERYHQRRAAGQDSYQAGRVVEASPGARGEAKRTAGMTLNQLRARLEELDADELLDLLRACAPRFPRHDCRHPFEDAIEVAWQVRSGSLVRPPPATTPVPRGRSPHPGRH